MLYCWNGVQVYVIDSLLVICCWNGVKLYVTYVIYIAGTVLQDAARMTREATLAARDIGI